MQPRRMQSPPSSLAPSTIAVLKPFSVATRAALNPALPPPITTKSKIFICRENQSRLRIGFYGEDREMRRIAIEIHGRRFGRKRIHGSALAVKFPKVIDERERIKNAVPIGIVVAF